MRALPRDREIVVYDSDPNEIASTHIVAELIRLGYRATALKGGISDWVDANLPTETKAAPKQAHARAGCIERLASRFLPNLADNRPSRSRGRCRSLPRSLASAATPPRSAC